MRHFSLDKRLKYCKQKWKEAFIGRKVNQEVLLHKLGGKVDFGRSKMRRKVQGRKARDIEAT
jgi:hypothetical protein